MNCLPISSSIALVTGLAVASLPLGGTALAGMSPESEAPAQSQTPEPPGPPAASEEDPLAQLPAPEGPAPASEAPAAAGTGPIVHVINEHPDEDRGLIKLARYRNTTQAGGSVVVLTTNYDEICTEPCGVPVDVTERPLFLFVRDGAPVSYGFRLKDDQEQVTLSLRPHRGKMHISGVLLTCFFIYPVGIPLIILGKAKVSIAPGAPSPGQKFRKLR